MSKFKIVETAPSATKYNSLRNILGWKQFSEEQAHRALYNSLYCACVYERECIIGMGRIVGDDCICFYIQDVMVIPEKQNQGVGKIIMNNLMNYLHINAAKGAYIGLMCKKGLTGFYEQYNFMSRPSETKGPGMVIYDFEPRYEKVYPGEF